VRGGGHDVKHRDHRAADRAALYRTGAWAPSRSRAALLLLAFLVGCAPSVTIPAGCTPSWNHVVGRADRESSVWTFGILCERGAAPRIVPGEPL